MFVDSFKPANRGIGFGLTPIILAMFPMKLVIITGKYSMESLILMCQFQSDLFELVQKCKFNE